MDPDQLEESPSFKSHIIEFIETLAVFVAIVMVIYFFIAQPHKVSGSSMFPNFHTGDYIITNKITYRFQEPKRGDIIVLKNPKDTSQDFIKRIIGLPNDQVKVQDGHVFINGKQLQEKYLDPSLLTPPGAFLREGQEITVEPGNYIVMGDNRTASSDSREWGYVPKEDIIGKVAFRYWPKDSFGLISGASYL